MEGILSEKAHIAKKDYDCTCCDGFIFGGQTYTRAYWKPEWHDSCDKPIDAKICTKCHTPEASRATPEADGYDYIRKHYGVPVRVGQIIEVSGHRGTVVPDKGSGQAYVWYREDGRKHADCAHPTWETVYYNEDGTIAADYRRKTKEG